MKKQIFTASIFVLLLAIACMFFPILSIDSANAIVEGVSGNKFVLTGLCGNSPEHYFFDASDQSTLVNAKTKQSSGEFYSICSDGGKTSSGWAEFKPTTEMQYFIEKGLLYACATANISSKNTTIKITISAGENSQEASTMNGALATPLLKLEDVQQNIRFSFESSGKKNDFVMDEPTIHLYTIIDSVTLLTENQKVSPGQILKIDAFNEVTNISGISGNFTSFSKINHQICYDFLEGGEYVEVVGSNFVISQNAPNGAKITFRACANKNSYSEEKQYSDNYVELVVDSEKVNIKVRTDFKEAATITGQGSYVPGKRVTLRAKTNQGYQFLGWYINDAFQTSENKLIVDAEFGKDIYAKFQKGISVKSITISDREYDGTTTIDSSLIRMDFSGIESGHEVSIVGLNLAYKDANVGQNKFANAIFDTLSLAGQNSDIYYLETEIIPLAYGTISKREIFLTPNISTKEYGYQDHAISYTATNLVEGESLTGSLARETGEAIGKYKILLGDLPERNSNYNIIFDDSVFFEILPRTLSLDNVVVDEKTYDGTTEAHIKAGLRNIYNNEDVDVEVFGEFVTKDVNANVEVKITKTELVGQDKDNYVLEDYSEQIFSTIYAKQVTVKALSCTNVYGDELQLQYTCDGLLPGDNFSGNLEIADKNVGKQEIKLGTLSNSNYVISFESAICTITPRNAFVVADEQFKIFGEDDPQLTYQVENLVGDDEIFGNLDREDGEDVGQYFIQLGTLSNTNYEIIFTTNVLNITKRQIVVEVGFKDKEYDGGNSVEFDVTYKNNITEAQFALNLDAKLNSIKCGVATINIESFDVECDKKENFDFEFKFLNSSIQISKRKVNIFVTNTTKIYGEHDPEFVYTARNVLEGDSLQINIARNPGEEVGQYQFVMEGDNVQSYYDLALTNSYFEILPKEVAISIDSYSKYFGDEDPEIEYKLEGKFCFDDDESILDGKISRKEGEVVGVYEYDLNGLSSNKNYFFTNTSNTNFIINKRPVVVTSFDSTKIYGEDDPKFSYEVSNEVDGQHLSVDILREYGEDVGKYLLYCNTNDSRYAITFVEAYLEIIPSDISIKADEKIKIYGDNDPYFSVTVTDGLLKNNDRVENIATGSMTRQEGEQTGVYIISQGDFSFGKNYNLTFEGGSLTIIKRQVTISAIATSKIYGDDDNNLTYKISENGLAFSDQIEGSLERDEGEDVGQYKIHKGSLSLNSNYQVDFVEGVYQILPRQIEIIPTNISKQFGDPDTEITYQIKGDLLEGDHLDGTLYRQKSDGTIENVGRYKIFCTLTNPNYEIVFADYYFSILPREIVIEADSFQISYGDKEPELSYKIVSGEILDGDNLSGGLYRMSGNSVGVYDIISTLTAGRNYTIKFQKGTVTILPIKLTLKCDDYQKIYGQEDPSFTYSIVEGELINGDELYGAITRQGGENIGTYDLVASVYNDNYNIEFLPAKLEILKKDVYLIVSVSDKIYDGTTNAYIKNAYVSGLVDDVYLDYDRKNSAHFVSTEIGKNIEVRIDDIKLTGEKSNNYNLIYPEKLLADITFDAIKNNEIVITTNDPVLEKDYTLDYVTEVVENTQKIEKYRIALKLNIWIAENGEVVDVDGMFTIKMNISKKLFEKNNIRVYQKNGQNYNLLACQKNDDNQLWISCDQLGEFYIVIEDETWLDYASYISIAVIILTIIGVIVIIFRKKNARKIKF